MLVPLGDFTLKYATGSGRYWCGEESRFPFGRETSFHRAESIFSFLDQGDHYSGYTVELFVQPDGNLATSRIDPEAW